MYTVHVEDVAAAAFALAQWMAKEGRQQANIIAGEELPSNDKSKIKEGKDLPDLNKKLVAPLFNLVSNGTPLFAFVALPRSRCGTGKECDFDSCSCSNCLHLQSDDSSSTLVSIGNEMCSLFGTTFGFHDFFLTTMARVSIDPGPFYPHYVASQIERALF